MPYRLWLTPGAGPAKAEKEIQLRGGVQGKRAWHCFRVTPEWIGSC
jgi:hypothetical protein